MAVGESVAAVRPAAPEDLEAVARIYAGYVETSTATFELQPPSTAEWHARHQQVTGRGLPFLVAESGGAVAGYAYCSPWKPRAAYRFTVEDSVYVDAAATGRGLGRALLNGLLSACAAAGVREVIAVIAESDSQAASVALHKQFGFVPTGRLTRVGHKHDRWLDTLLLQRSLRP